MTQRGRKSADTLSIVAGRIDERPRAPAGLSEAQSIIWERIVANEAWDVFKTAACQRMLLDLCRHASTADTLTAEIDRFDGEWTRDGDGIRHLNRLLAMRERETRAVADKATKLRLTNQSRYTPRAAATAAQASGGPKPWDGAPDMPNNPRARA